MSQLPGPGAYDPRPPKIVPAFSLGAKAVHFEPEDLPGPGNYDRVTPSATKHKNPSFDFSRSPERFVSHRKSINVGPG